MNVCGMPGAPTDATCLTETEAQAIDLALDGPFNDQGHRVWYSNGRGAPEFQLGPLGPRGTGFLDIYAIVDMPLAAWRKWPTTIAQGRLSFPATGPAWRRQSLRSLLPARRR